MTTTISVAGLFLALFLLVYLAFKGHSVIIIAPIVAMVAVIFSAGFDSHLMANYTEGIIFPCIYSGQSLQN